jgi:acetyl esterase/lipase
MPAQDILTLPAPPADVRLSYGSEPQQFGELRLPKSGSSHPLVMNLHGGFWRSSYTLAHAGHLCAALTAKGAASWNLEYRRVGNPGGGWPGSFEDIRNGFRFITQAGAKYDLDPARILVMGHSAGGQLALCLAAHEPSVKRAVSLAGVVDLGEAWELHLGDDAVVGFLGGTPKQVPDHYEEADPLGLHLKATQWLVHGAADDVVPASLSRNYAETKKGRGEDVHYLEIASAGHLDLIDPRSSAWPKVEATILHLLNS